MLQSASSMTNFDLHSLLLLVQGHDQRTWVNNHKGLDLFVYNLDEEKSSNSISFTLIHCPNPGLQMGFPLVLMTVSVPSWVLITSCMLKVNPPFPF